MLNDTTIQQYNDITEAYSNRGPNRRPNRLRIGFSIHRVLDGSSIGLNQKGFTIAELLVSTFILGVLIATATGIYTNFFNSYRNIKAANIVYEEARFVMERIVKEVRNGSVDYEEYYNQAANFFGTGINETYGQNYCQYSRQFYSAGPDGKYGTYDDESTGIRNEDTPAPLESPIQEKLYLIDPTGTHRTYLRRIETTDELGNTIGKIALLKLVGKDYGIDHLSDGENSLRCGRDQGEKDGLVDTWVCDEGFECDRITPGDLPPSCIFGYTEIIRDDPDDLENSSYMDITPASLDVVDLKFFITPSDDPRKAYADADVQIQPHVTIKMIIRASPRIASQIRGSTPDIVLESTVSSRTQTEIITECNLQECIDGDMRPCPKNQGIVAGAQQTCSQGVWPGCSDIIYEEQAFDNIVSGLITPVRMEGELFVPIDPPEPDGLDHEPPFDTEGGRTYYEGGKNEMNSCDGDDECKNRRCHDDVDNDGDGLTDEEDPNCLVHLCNNGYLDPGEACIDVGGACYFRPLALSETNCSDGYDNDCNYDFELTWEDIVTAGLEDYMAYEGLDENSSVAEWNIALRQGADEYDQNCIDIMCTNGVKDPTDVILGPRFYDNPNYLFGKPESDELHEICIDIGGLCDRATAPDDPIHHRLVNEGDEVGVLCVDGLDNDCDYDPLDDSGGADEFDPDCTATICSNTLHDQALAGISVLDQNPPDPDDYVWYDFLGHYTDFEAPFDIDTELDEICTDTGGLCQNIKPYEEGGETICNDGVDNDCDILFDGNQGINSDEDCCPDNDNDSFMGPIGVMTCETEDKKADSYGPYGIIDCNDDDASIRPFIDNDGNGLFDVGTDDDNPELCDDATYGVGSPLVGEPIDNNCSFVNARYAVAIGDDGWDHSDRACCMDTDADGFGIQDANLYKGNPPECNATLMALEERPTYDCDDTNINIHPNILENTHDKCIDGLNNNCRVSAVTGHERFDHIDTKADPLAALADETFEPECCNVTGFPFNTNLEVCNDTLSLAGDGSNSDENCNGLVGINDHYCLDWNQRSFFDQLSSQNYIQSYDDTITYADGTYTLNASGAPIEGEIISESLPFNPASCPRVLNARIQNAVFDDKFADSGGMTEIKWQLSNDGGLTWCGPMDCSGNNWLSTADIGVNVNFGPNDNNLVWKAKLSDSAGTFSPWLSEIRVSFTCP
ncbi:prepilin-type N-terminal cleavage/methylation domain-containing protein [Candidatus Peregrinibacteria bacterium]|nr:prepilin-type N-terminal cleavage/methylation domain-containing protein [Candidatus Peregrinibacteria bacterium]